ncbi:MAG: heme-binding protein [Novosphingobium sp.]
MNLSADALQSALSAAARKAEAMGVAVNIALVDAGGNLAAFLRMPGAFLASIDIAIDKAWTANSFGMSTTDFAAMLEGESAMVRDGLMSRHRVAAFPGGHPLRRDDAMLGAIGVSGASAGQDDEIALAGLMALTEK